MSFSLVRLIPGDPVQNLLGERGGTPEQIEQIKKNFGLDKSLPEQYYLFIRNAISGNMGRSVVSQRGVTEEFLARFPATLELGFVALIWSSLVGIPLGIIAAYKRNSVWDYGVTGVSLLGFSMPIFWWGLLLILVFSVNLGWFPVSGRISVMFDVPMKTGFYLIDSWSQGKDAFFSALQHLVLPAIVLGTIPLAILTRITRSSLLEVMNEDYIRAAKARGVSTGKIILKHALSNALLPIITILGFLVGSIMTGAVLTESIFSWPGVGKWLIKSIEARDYPVIQGGILYISASIVVVNIIMDVVYTFLNPRLKK
ncbi:MAG: ABC transporter permease, partial [Bdellovibrionales bacterium]|nr:ABC transporter permease [Bdellovibrionales bacterium]